MAKTQQQLLDELDEARIVAKSYRRGWLRVGFAVMLSLGMILTGAVVGMWSSTVKVDFGGQATLFIILGIVGLIASALAGAWWFKRNDLNPSTAARLRAAERAYHNSMLEQS